MRSDWYWYLLYSVVLCVPQIHEYGHAVIAWLTGYEVHGFGVWFVMTENTGFQKAWEWSGFFSLCCTLAWGYFYIHDKQYHSIRVHRNETV